jgi:hypothetical protein
MVKKRKKGRTNKDESVLYNVRFYSPTKDGFMAIHARSSPVSGHVTYVPGACAPTYIDSFRSRSCDLLF